MVGLGWSYATDWHSRNPGRGVAFMRAALIAGALFASAAPNTAITAGPVGRSGLASPTFEFTGENANAFECSIDGSPYVACESPQKVGPLAPGEHTFDVRAVATDSSVDDTPASRRWIYEAAPLTNVRIKLRRPAKARLERKAFTSVVGSATSGSGTPVTSVQVGLQVGKPDKSGFPPGCNFVNLKTALPSFRPCVLPDFTTVNGTQQWSFRVPARVRKALKPGSYTVIIRAFTSFGQASRRDYKLTLR